MTYSKSKTTFNFGFEKQHSHLILGDKSWQLRQQGDYQAIESGSKP